MMKIYFKNGMSTSIPKEAAEVLNKHILEGCNNWQTFTDINSNIGLFLMLNLSEIVYIKKEES